MFNPIMFVINMFRVGSVVQNVYQYTEKYVCRDRGYQPYETERTVQKLVETTYNKHGWRLSRRTLDTDIVPEHVMIGIGCTGYDISNWRSKFADVIDEQRRRKLQAAAA